MPGPLVPVLLGGGVLATLLLLNKREKDAAAKMVSAQPAQLPAPAPVPANLPPLPGGFIQSVNVAPTVRDDGSVLSQLKTNPDGTPHELGTPITFATHEEAAAGVDRANQLGLTAFEVELVKSGAKLAKVTTNDPPPLGDLIMRLAPNEGAAQVPGGGAEKDGRVTIIRDVDGVWSEIFWRGGDRRPFAQGFAKRKFLAILPTPTGLV